MLAISADATGDVGATVRNPVPITQHHRDEEPFFQHASTGDDFEAALRKAVRTNATSMSNLHDCVRQCMGSLRLDGMQCESALLTMKAFIRELGLKHARHGSKDLIHSELMMDQIVKWCISDYYEHS